MIAATKSANDDLLEPGLIHDPFPYYRELREHRPVQWNERWRGWIVSKNFRQAARNARRESANSSAELSWPNSWVSMARISRTDRMQWSGTSIDSGA